MKYPGKRMRCLIKPLGIIQNGLPGNCLDLIIKMVTTSRACQGHENGNVHQCVAGGGMVWPDV